MKADVEFDFTILEDTDMSGDNMGGFNFGQN